MLAGQTDWLSHWRSEAKSLLILLETPRWYADADADGEHARIQRVTESSFDDKLYLRELKKQPAQK